MNRVQQGMYETITALRQEGMTATQISYKIGNVKPAATFYAKGMIPAPKLSKIRNKRYSVPRWNYDKVYYVCLAIDKGIPPYRYTRVKPKSTHTTAEINKIRLKIAREHDFLTYQKYRENHILAKTKHTTYTAYSNALAAVRRKQEDNIDTAERIANKLKETGESAYHAAKRLGMSRQYLSLVKQGNIIPRSPEKRQKIFGTLLGMPESKWPI